MAEENNFTLRSLNEKIDKADQKYKWVQQDARNNNGLILALRKELDEIKKSMEEFKNAVYELTLNVRALSDD